MLNLLFLKLIKSIRVSKNRDGRYYNFIKIISSASTLTLVYFLENKKFFGKVKNLNSIILNTINKKKIERISRWIFKNFYKIV